MTIWFAGNEPGELSGTFDVTTTTTHFRSANVRCALGGVPGKIVVKDLASEVGANSATGWWLHFFGMYTGFDTYLNNENMLVAKDGSNNTIISCVSWASGTGSFRLTVGASTDTSILFPVIMTAGYLTQYDFHCYTVAGTTYLKIYINTYLADTLSVSGNNPGLKSWILDSPSSSASQTCYFSEHIVADVDTRFLNVRTLYPSGNGAHVAWTGDYNDVDEIALDGNAISTSSTGDLETFTFTATGSGTGGGVLAVCVNMLGNSDGSGDLQAVARTGGTDYVSSDLGAIGTAGLLTGVFNTNPAGGVFPNISSLVSNFEFGVKSVA